MTISVAQVNKTFIALEEQSSIDTPASDIQPIWFDTNGFMNVSDILTDTVIARNKYSVNLGSISDDAVAIFALGLVVGTFVALVPNAGTRPMAILWVRTLSSTTPVIMGSGTNTGDLNLSTSILAGTTGTDAKLTFSANSNGNIYVENRLGSAVSYRLDVVGE